MQSSVNLISNLIAFGVLLVRGSNSRGLPCGFLTQYLLLICVQPVWRVGITSFLGDAAIVGASLVMHWWGLMGWLCMTPTTQSLSW